MFEKYAQANFSSYEDFHKNFKINVPERFNFAYDVLDELARTKPDKTALYWTNEAGEKRVFSFADMKRLSDKAANYLTSLGIGKGDMVMIILKRDWQFWYTIMALHKIGAVTIPATHLLTPKDITYRVNAASVKAVICTGSGDVAQHVDDAQDVPTLKYKLICGDREGWLNYDRGVEEASEHFTRPAPEDSPANDDMMLLYFTSGTTGMPKMVAHSFTYPLGHIPTAVFWHNADPDGLHLTVSETGWAKSVWGKLYGQWLAETAIFVYDHEKFVPANMLRAICEHKVTTFCAPPTVYRYFIKEDLSQYDFSHLKWATTAGEPLNPEVYHQFYKATGLKLYEIYGQTELVVTVGTFIWMEPKPGSMGKPSPLFDVDIVNEAGEPCKWGEAGEIVVRTDKGTNPGMFLGYYRDEELTRKVWHDGMYHTGDVAWRDEDGYFWYVGRTDDVIKSSGYRIGPFEVESALMEHPAVLETAITGVPHPERGQVVKATIVLAKGYQPSDELAKELQEHVKRVTAPYKYPRVIEFVDELPKTISGKIRRVELRERDRNKQGE
ncbi:MAG: AMP-binding protein [Christensenellaceae bacterium]|nr:AMP-binding protein [Christensenellaceae bacterium]